MNKHLCLLTLMALVPLAWCEVKVTNVEVKPRWPWNGKVDVTYSIECDEVDDEGNPKDIYVDFTGIDHDRNREIKMRSLTGDGVSEAVKAGGPYTVTWDAAKDEPALSSSKFDVKINASFLGLYMIVDLEKWTVRYSSVGPNLDNDTCRTTELWLRKIMPGTYMMGSPSNELGRFSNETQHEVTITQMFYIGVFECTQRQWELLMGTRPSYFSNSNYYATRPVESVSYDMLRGTSATGGEGWPNYGHAVDADSFFGRLQAKTGLLFDLPTESEWEYACRAGTTTALNSGKNLSSTDQDANMAEVGRYWYNGGLGYSSSCATANGTAKVGSYLPNAWGLYDMHGNVWEWCLDWQGAYPTGVVNDPVGLLTGSYRVKRGGCWGDKHYAQYCRSAYRGCNDPSNNGINSGFRAACWPNLEEDVYAVVDLSGGSEAESYPVRYTSVSPDLSDDTCRTTELWLRKIKPGTFVMGSPDDEVGRSGNEQRHLVAFNQAYFIGVFECTQKQWELVMGSNPSTYKGDTRPVENISYDMMRGDSPTAGAGWPTYGHTVDAVSFFGRLQAKTGLLFDLPTEAQWEYACRAGTSTALNTNKNLSDSVSCPNMAEVGRYVDNQTDGKGGYSTHTKVGSYLPNAWGLYDMHGNLCECCLDWYGGYSRIEVVEPKGATTGTNRIYRGGAWKHEAHICRSAARSFYGDTSYCSYSIGFRICIQPEPAPALYAVVDLSGGQEAESYPVRYTSEPPDLTDDACRTTELWLRKIMPGSFTMGSPEDELGRSNNERQHEVTLTQGYFIGVFECTQKQWELIMGNNPLNDIYFKGDTRPISMVSYDMIRGDTPTAGAGWPTYGHAVDATSFLGKLQAKTGLVFDLPTEAEWEYACRAGTTTALNSGKNLTDIGSCPNMAEVGRYGYYSGKEQDLIGGYAQHTSVGCYLPNAWGLFDMHGNVFEWCLDWIMFSAAPVVDPVGNTTGEKRSCRGGGWHSDASFCRSAQRNQIIPSGTYSDLGFRICCYPEIDLYTVYLGDVRIDMRTSIGGRLLHGTERISPVNVNESLDTRLSVEGRNVDGWSPRKPLFNSRNEEDGWRTFALNEGTKNTLVELLVLKNATVAIHGGVLEADETWGTEAIHIVRNWVRIPEGKTLTIEEGTIVKFCEATGIQTDGTLVATGATFTSIEDDSVGGDTDMNGENGVLAYGVYSFTGNGMRTMTECDVRYSANLPVNTTWATGSVNHIYGTLTVGSGVTLTIAPGTIVKLATGAELKADTGANIIANGALFTHIADDSEEAGGDTNGDGNASMPLYDTYKLTGFTPAADCELRFLTLTFEGGTISDMKTLSRNHVHKVTGNITIASGGKLIVQPGAIVKMGEGLSITVQSGGTLEAIGNRAQPIVFTSIKDDEHGGDTNGDGDKSEAIGGDWKYIYVQGQACLQYCTLMYGAPTNETGIVETAGNGVLEMDCCTVAHAQFDGIWNWGGSITVRNSIITDVGLGAAPYRGSKNEYTNCVFYEDNYLAMYWSHWTGNPVFNNCVFKNMGNDWLDVSGYANAYNVVRFNHCVFHNDSGYPVQSCVKNGVNGNLYADPLFTAPGSGDFTLKAGSPCIDAGDGNVAPELDFFGQPRQDIREAADMGTAGENGTVPDIGIYEALPKNVTTMVDLVALSVECKQEAVLVGNALDVSWIVRNEGSEAAEGTWRDYLYMVSADGQETLLGTLSTTGSIAPNGMRTIWGRFTVPDVNEGEYILRVKANQNRDIFEGALTANNILNSENTVSISYPKAPVKDGIEGHLLAGESEVHLLDVEDGYSLALINAPSGTTVYYSLGTIPTADMHISSVTCLDGETMLSLPIGEIYLLIVAPNDETCDYSIDFTEDCLQIQSVSQVRLPATRKSFVRVHGARFASDAEVCLVKGAEKIDVSAYIPGDNDIWITIDNGKLSPGNYDLQVTSLGETATQENAFLATADEGRMELSYRVVQPNSARVGRVFTATLEFENTGTVAMPAPIFVLEAPYRNFIVNDETYEQKVMLYGTGTEYPAGYLLPGVKQTLTFQMQITSNNDNGLSYQAFHAGTAGAKEALFMEDFYPADYLEYMQNVSPEELSSLMQAIGKTWGDFYFGMAEYVTQMVMSPEALLVYEDVKQAYLNYAAAQRQSDETEYETEETTRAGCYLNSDSRLWGNTGTYSDKYYVIVPVDLGDYLYSAKPVYLESEKGYFDFAHDESYPGQIWWYHAASGDWHRIGEKNSLFTDVCAHISQNDTTGDWYLICHGNENSIHQDWILDMAKKIHSKKSKANIFAVDWGDAAMFTKNGASPEKTAPYIPGVAKAAVAQLKRIQELFSLNTGNLTIIGHSHGAHLGGEIASQLSGTPKRLVALDASPIWTHERASTRYPTAWNGSVARQVEFYKTSWGFSMGSSDNSEVFGEPSFFVVKDELDKDLFTRVGKKGTFDAAGKSLNRHAFAHEWLRKSIAKSSDLGWNWNGASWLNNGFGNTTTLASGSFHGVIYKNGHMELGRKCVDAINVPRREYQPKITEATWRYDAIVLGRQFDFALGVSGFSGMERLWNLWSMLVEYRAYGIGVNNDRGGGRAIKAGSNVKFTFLVENVADNISINSARRLANFNGTDWDDRYPSVVPWKYRVYKNGKEDYGITNTLSVYDLSRLGVSDKEQLIQDINSHDFNSSMLSYALSECDSSLLCQWEGFDYFLPAGGKYMPMMKTDRFVPSFARRTWELGKKPNGEVYDADKGEPFLLIGRAAQFKVGDTITDYYPGDLFYGDNIWATIVYVTPERGELEARLERVASTRSASAEENRGAGDEFVQQTLFEVTSEEDGSWSLTFSAEKSICSAGLKYYYWTTKDFSPSSGSTMTPYFRTTGKLKEEIRSKDYSLSLTVYDQLGDSDSVDVTIRVKRPEEKCMNCTPETCICTLGECNCNGCMEQDPKPDKPQSDDPNEMAGMYGFGDAATQRFVQPGEEMTYTIYFENKAEATAAAQEVRVTSELSKWLDWSSFQVVEVGFRNQIDTGLTGKASGTSEIALVGTAWKVRTETELNTKNGVVKWYLRIVDETTADGWPESAYDGFLSPNDDKHSGEGYIRYKVKVRDDAPKGTRIDAAATIVFDYNDPITTSPAWYNWVNGDETLAETGVLTWDGVEGASYEVSIWSGDPDAASESAVAAAASGPLSENRWRIPDGLAEGTTYFWRVATTDAAGNETQSPVWGFDLGGRVRYELMPGWNLVSVPFVPDAYSAKFLARYKEFELQNGGYVKASALEAGRAYWVFQASNDTQVFDLLNSGTRVQQSMDLHDGWNLVGATETDTTVDGAYTVWMFSEGEWGLLETEADGLYHLEVGQGYFIYLPGADEEP